MLITQPTSILSVRIHCGCTFHLKVAFMASSHWSGTYQQRDRSRKIKHLFRDGIFTLSHGTCFYCSHDIVERSKMHAKMVLAYVTELLLRHNTAESQGTTSSMLCRHKCLIRPDNGLIQFPTFEKNLNKNRILLTSRKI